MHAATRATIVEAVTTRLPPRAFPFALSFARDAAEPRTLPLSCRSSSLGAGLDNSGAYFGGGGGGGAAAPRVSSRRGSVIRMPLRFYASALMYSMPPM